MYILLLFLILSIVGGIIQYKECKKNKYNESPLGFFILLISGIVLFFMLIDLIYNQTVGTDKMLYRHKVMQEQYENIRSKENNPIERAAIAKDIIDYNLYLSDEKYDNNNQWDWWVNDKVDKLDYIK